MEVSYAVWKRMRTLGSESGPEECNFCGKENKFAGVEQDTVDLKLPEEGPDLTLMLLT